MISLNSVITRKKMMLAAMLAIAFVVFAGIEALPSQGLAQAQSPFMLGGIIADFTPVLDANGPWQVTGEWSLNLRGDSGRGDFSAAISMVRSDNPNRSPHTHRITMSNAEVTPLENGFRLSGVAVITSNGNLAFSGSTVTVDVTGGNTIAYSNIALRFDGPAAGHFSDQALHGVVTKP